MKNYVFWLLYVISAIALGAAIFVITKIAAL